MNRDIFVPAFALIFISMLAPTIQASEYSISTTLTSEYIFRGLKRSDGQPALQLGVDYEHDSGVFAGVWGSTIDIQSPAGKRDLELDFYAGFHHRFQAPLSATLTLLRYTYPGQTGFHSYDYNEVLVSATWQDRYSVELGMTRDLNGLGHDSRHWEFQLDYPVANTWVLGATLGLNDMSDAGVSRYFYWDVGASVRWSRMIFDLRWFDNERPDGFAARDSAGSQWVVSFRMTF
ncbi:MAG TPA: TorF family putative porin [Xanthomonadales bacterium]|nr:TorF family putative porin [Xanthomonadales bacterium]